MIYSVDLTALSWKNESPLKVGYCAKKGLSLKSTEMRILPLFGLLHSPKRVLNQM